MNSKEGITIKEIKIHELYLKMIQVNQIIREKNLPEDLLFEEDELNFVINNE